MGALERFNLRWDGFEANTKAALRQLREEGEFFDVTLVGSDGKQVEANKVILAGGSSFFHKILKENPHPHPLIYLQGVSSQYLLSVLDFLYTGEGNIVQKDLNGFLRIAQDLKVKGLTPTGIQSNKFPSSPAPLQSQETADKKTISHKVSYPHSAATPASPQGQVATEECVVSPRISHPHIAISASRQGHVATEELSPKASYPHSTVSTTPDDFILVTEETGLSPRASYSHSSDSTSFQDLVAFEDPTTTLRVSDLSNTVTQASGKEDNADTCKVKVEFEEGDAAYYNVSYGINDDGEHYIRHVSIRGLEDSAENILRGNSINRQNFQNASEQSEDYQDEGMRLCSKQEVNPKKTLIDSSSNVVIKEAMKYSENNTYELDDKSKMVLSGPEDDNIELNKENNIRLDQEDMLDSNRNMVVTEAADSGFISEQSTYDCCEHTEENEDGNVIFEGELDFNEEKCFYCTKTFSKSSELKKHKMMHIGEKQFQCLFCYKVFSAWGKLTVHKKTHADKKKFQCFVCFKRFSQLGGLSRHKWIHTDEKPYQCLQCFKRFKRMDHLDNHKMSHAVEKLFQCSVCFKKFSRKDTLNKHEKYHTAEKPHQCLQCNKKFSQQSKLQKHKKDTH